jgi:hypothetical protein
MTPNNTADLPIKERRERTDLGRQYGDIGISAVAAALRYCQAPRTPATVSQGSRDDESRDPAA